MHAWSLIFAVRRKLEGLSVLAEFCAETSRIVSILGYVTDPKIGIQF
jgi:hypothetical protein